jgi:hypothetical protein
MIRLRQLLKLFRRRPRPAPRPCEVTYVPYARAASLLAAGEGWHVSTRDEDSRRSGWVYLEREAPHEQSA